MKAVVSNLDDSRDKSDEEILVDDITVKLDEGSKDPLA
jgi:hypothetical protein